MGFARTIATFARSPQGKKVFSEASRLAKDPATRKKIQDARKSLSQKRPPGTQG